MKRIFLVICFILSVIFLAAQPTTIDNRIFQSPVKNQGDRNTCSGFAVAACLETFPGVPTDLSEQHIYAGLKMLEYNSADPVEGGGRLNLYPQTLSKYGMLEESRMRYDPKQLDFSVRDSNLVQIIRETQTGPVSMLVNNKYVKSYVREEDCEVAEFDAGLETQHIKRLLQQGVKAIGIGYYVNAFWFDWMHRKDLLITPDSVGGFIDSNRVIRTFEQLRTEYDDKLFDNIDNVFKPSYNKEWTFGSNQSSQGHAITIVGYNEKGFIIKNSWGKEWGDNGYATVSYAYHRLFAKRMLAVKKISFSRKPVVPLTLQTDLRLKIIPQGSSKGLSVSVYCLDEGTNPIILSVQYQLYRVSKGIKKLIGSKIAITDIMQKEYKNSFETVIGEVTPISVMDKKSSLQMEIIFTGVVKVKRVYKNIQWANSEYKGEP